MYIPIYILRTLGFIYIYFDGTLSEVMTLEVVYLYNWTIYEIVGRGTYTKTENHSYNYVFIVYLYDGFILQSMSILIHLTLSHETYIRIFNIRGTATTIIS